MRQFRAVYTEGVKWQQKMGFHGLGLELIRKKTIENGNETNKFERPAMEFRPNLGWKMELAPPPPLPSQDPIYSSVCVGITKLISALRIHRGFFPTSNDSTHKSMKEQKSLKLLLEYILLVIIILTI